MTTSQFIMFLALDCIALTWIISWAIGHRAPVIQKIFAALCVQAVAAIFLSFSSGSLILSLVLAAIISGAVAWMVHTGSRENRVNG